LRPHSPFPSSSSTFVSVFAWFQRDKVGVPAIVVSFLAVDNVSFTVGQAEILGYLGPNGEDYS
jgi:ABC-type multidrug transport system ATPase subunit